MNAAPLLSVQAFVSCRGGIGPYIDPHQTRPRTESGLLARTTIAAGILLLAPAAAGAQEFATPWHQGHNSKVRLIAGNLGHAGEPRLLAGIEIRLAEGWKTYWRNPGESGGVPPRFDLSASRNLGAARIRYPAPERLKDALGDSIGYKHAVVFPIEVAAADPTRPVELDVALEYGVCRDICIPAEARLATSLPPGLAAGVPPELAAASARVPRKTGERRPTDPVLKTARAMLSGGNPSLTLEVSGTDTDLFLMAPPGIFLPVPKRTAGAPAGNSRFVVDLSQDNEAAQLKGKTLVLTIVSAAGASEAVWVVE